MIKTERGDYVNGFKAESVTIVGHGNEYIVYVNFESGNRVTAMRCIEEDRHLAQRYAKHLARDLSNDGVRP